MIIDTASDKMKWILMMFLEDSMALLVNNPNPTKMTWVKIWMNSNLSDKHIANGMPTDDD